MPSVLAVEQSLLKATNGKSCETEISLLTKSCYKNDINWSDFSRHIPILNDVMKKGCPNVNKVTSIDTICEAMNSNDFFKEILPTIHQMIRLYLTVPVTSTSERIFSALWRLLTYLRSSMTEKRLNHCTYIRKLQSLDLVSVGKEFIDMYDERNILYLYYFEGMHALCMYVIVYYGKHGYFNGDNSTKLVLL